MEEKYKVISRKFPNGEISTSYQQIISNESAVDISSCTKPNLLKVRDSNINILTTKGLERAVKVETEITIAI